MIRITHYQPVHTRILTGVLISIVTLGAVGELSAQDSTRASATATRMAVEEARVISVAEVGLESRAVSVTSVGKEVAPGIYQVDPDSIQGKRLIMPATGSSAALVKVGVCIGVWHKKKQRCIGIWIQNG